MAGITKKDAARVVQQLEKSPVVVIEDSPERRLTCGRNRNDLNSVGEMATKGTWISKAYERRSPGGRSFHTAEEVAQCRQEAIRKREEEDPELGVAYKRLVEDLRTETLSGEFDPSFGPASANKLLLGSSMCSVLIG